SGAYNDLVLVLIGRSNDSSAGNPQWRFNNDSGGNYHYEGQQFSGSTTVAPADSFGAAQMGVGMLPASTALANSFGHTEITVYGYASTTWLKAFSWHSYALTSTTAGTQRVHVGGGLWKSTAAVTRVLVMNDNLSSLAVGSQLRIYGRL